jgi:hypothetical protein
MPLGEQRSSRAGRALRIEQLMSVSNAGQLMPPKRTWIEPKVKVLLEPRQTESNTRSKGYPESLSGSVGNHGNC